ncbi:UNKNOWN [Stylonychia lemnae]|uniref:Morn repeat protein n=1 Tax=Stylonychia lemnae TaxID=5949 RepID=A0A077ZQ39_STYLE|nr:UNKNOWN [Stylonychia lemnae]|eukprot:CDW72018.1 UNKNOWN [Stylonychia lemnae]
MRKTETDKNQSFRESKTNTDNTAIVTGNELDKFYFSVDKFKNETRNGRNSPSTDEVKIKTDRDESESFVNINGKQSSSMMSNASNHQSPELQKPQIIQENRISTEYPSMHQKVGEQNQQETLLEKHPDTSPRKMPPIRLEPDQLKASMVIPQLSLQLQQTEDGEAFEYGSNTQRVINLEKKFGGYRMISQLFKYEDLRLMVDFQILKFKDAIFRGQIKNGERREGLGVMLYDNGRTYEGQWQNDRRHGQGFEKYSNLNTYEGEFVRGKANGKGIYKWKNGEIYEGDWLNGQKEGKGFWRNTFGESYEGDWRDNKANGYGVHHWSTGEKYEGDWFDFLKHGFGTDYFANGDRYTGQYRYGKPWGRGKYTWSSGATYEGDFEDGHKHGKGKWEKKQVMNNEQTGAETIIHVYYEGEYKNDVKEGYGQYKWASGNYYKGYYKNDKRHFYGEMYWNDGSIYKGEWCDGVQHGYGKMIFATGEVKEGFFDNGVFKFEGNELQIKQYMKINNIKTSASEQSKETSYKQSNNTTSKKNVQFQGGDANDTSFVSQNKIRLGKRSSVVSQMKGSQANQASNFNINLKSNKKQLNPINQNNNYNHNQQRLRKNESVPSLHRNPKDLINDFNSPTSVGMSDSYLQEGDYNPNKKFFAKDMRRQGKSLTNDKQPPSSQIIRKKPESNGNNNNFGLSHISEISQEENTFTGQKKQIHLNKLNKVASEQFLPSIENRYINKHQINGKQARTNLSHSNDYYEMGQPQVVIKNQRFNNNFMMPMRTNTSQSQLRDIPQPIMHRPWIPSGIIQRNDGVYVKPQGTYNNPII